MDLLNEKINKIYFKCLLAAFGSAMISCIYGVVDMAVVGRYQGPSGTAALAIVAPVWNIIYSLGLLMGIGGSVILATMRGKKLNDSEDNQFFTVSILGSVILSILTWVAIIFFEKQILIFFGASDNELLNLAHEYLKPIKFVLPLFLFNQTLAAFLRNDDDPVLATVAVLTGGIFNVFGDIFFTFTLNMGIFGAGLATAIGSVISFVVMTSHFFKKKNTLKIVKSKEIVKKLKLITINGFSTFFIDVAMGILTIIFNRQIMKYLSTAELAVYGPIINISTFVQCCAYSVGQASQPIISINYGAQNSKRIKETLKLSIITVLVMGAIWTLISCAVPNMYINIFMKPTDEVLRIAPSIIRKYSISFLILPINIFSTYYFQSILVPKKALVVSISRGLVVSGILLIVLPLLNPNAIWFTMPITELIVLVYVISSLIVCTKQLDNLKQSVV